MKRQKGFTLIELLIVTVVIVTLMGIVFRLSGIGSGVRAKNVTISRIQRLENALSGYYAAFGSYPPVPLHGLQDMNLECDDTGLLIPGTTGAGNWSAGGRDEMQRQIRAVCLAQPVAACYPYEDTTGNRDYIRSLSDEIKEMCGDRDNYPQWAARSAAFSSGFSGLTRNIFGNRLNDMKDWQDIRIFKFGLLSFLLPRYLFMLEGKEEFYDDCRQWEANNRKITDFITGRQVSTWAEVKRALGVGATSGGNGNNPALASMITNLPTQAVCARWMPNFKQMIAGGRTFYGVDTGDGHVYNSVNDADGFMVYSPNSNGSSGNAYILNGMTVLDGWNRDLYYHSAPPYQSYTVWSAGPDGKTFPPWIDLESLPGDEARKVAAEWMKDDIIHLSN